MADGNFAYHIPRTKRDDALEKLTLLVNWLAEEMEGSLFHLGYVNPHISYQYTIQSTYLLDENGAINNFSTDIPDLLGITSNELMGTHFSEILERKSRESWLTIKKLLQQRKITRTALFLDFETSKKLTVSAACNILWLFDRKKIMVALFKVIIEGNQNPLQKSKKKLNKKTPNKEDIQLIQSVHEYVLAHKNASFPPLRELAMKFGTNEFKLKTGFQQLFNTSIYKLYTDQRLKRALLLIQHTNLPLKEIAFMCEYNTYSNFSRAFKINYGCPPSAISRKAFK